MCALFSKEGAEVNEIPLLQVTLGQPCSESESAKCESEVAQIESVSLLKDTRKVERERANLVPLKRRT